MKKEVEYCDDCGKVLNGLRVPYSSLPINVASANAGESALLCLRCHDGLVQSVIRRLDESNPDMGSERDSLVDDGTESMQSFNDRRDVPSLDSIPDYMDDCDPDE